MPPGVAFRAAFRQRIDSRVVTLNDNGSTVLIDFVASSADELVDVDTVQLSELFSFMAWISAWL